MQMIPKLANDPFTAERGRDSTPVHTPKNSNSLPFAADQNEPRSKSTSREPSSNIMAQRERERGGGKPVTERNGWLVALVLPPSLPPCWTSGGRARLAALSLPPLNVRAEGGIMEIVKLSKLNCRPSCHPSRSPVRPSSRPAPVPAGSRRSGFCPSRRGRGVGHLPQAPSPSRAARPNAASRHRWESSW